MSKGVRWSELGALVGGELSTRTADLARAGRDFGNETFRPPAAVLRPADAHDVAAAIRFGLGAGIPVVPRGSGHSVDGQATAPDGIVVDLTSLREIRRSGEHRLTVGAGTRWGAVVSVSLAEGLIPPVVPDYLGLSVGGTVAVGGVGGTSHRRGLVSDNLVELEVVTLEGTVRTCSPSESSTLFDAVRGTQGRHGVITRVTLELDEAAHRVSACGEILPDLRTLLARQRELAVDSRYAHVEARIGHAPEHDWSFTLSKARFLDATEVSGLSADERIGLIAHADHVDRNAPAVMRDQARGTWYEAPHPRRSVLLPYHSAEYVIGRVLESHRRSGLGEGGHGLLMVLPSEQIRTPALPRSDDEFTVLFGVQATGTPGDGAGLARMKRVNELLSRLARSMGGGLYAAGGSLNL